MPQPLPLPLHVQWLQTHRGHALKAVLDSQDAGFEAEDALAILVQADPSPGSHAVQWLCDTLLAGGYLWEDVAGGRTSRAGQTLDWFALHRARLPSGQRNLEDHKGLASIYSAVQPWLGDQDVDTNQPVGRALRRVQRHQAWAESIIVCNRPDLVVAVPLTRMASCWWGRGTQWCTAAREHNAFDHYNRVAPLIVVVLPGVALQSPGVALQSPGVASGGGQTLQRAAKLQLHVPPKGRSQFMDASDGAVDAGFIREHWNLLEPLIAWVLARGGDIGRDIPGDLCTGELARMLVTINGLYLSRLERQHRTAELCTIALRDTGNALDYVPPDILDHDMCALALASRPMMLARVPDHLLCHELCLQAVSVNGVCLAHVPDHLRSERVVEEAISNKGAMLEVVEQSRRSPHLCSLAVQQSGFALSHVPRHLRTPLLCLQAVQNYGRALRYVPMDMWTSELVELALANNAQAIEIVVEMAPHLLTPELCMAAVVGSPIALIYLPDKYKTSDVARVAVAGDAHMLAHVPNHIKDTDMCGVAVSTQGTVIEHVPDHLRTKALCMQAVDKNPHAICYLDKAELDQEMCTLAVTRAPGLLAKLPQHLLTQEVRRAVVEATALMQSRPPTPARPLEWQSDVALQGLAKALERTAALASPVPQVSPVL